jgi:hypothetical protein
MWSVVGVAVRVYEISHVRWKPALRHDFELDVEALASQHFTPIHMIWFVLVPRR